MRPATPAKEERRSWVCGTGAVPRRRGLPGLIQPPCLSAHRLITRVMTFLFPAPDASSLRLCRAEVFMVLGQHPQALEDLEAVCRAEPGEHEVSGGGGPTSRLRLEPNLTVWEQFPSFLNSPGHWVHPAQKYTCQTR